MSLSSRGRSPMPRLPDRTIACRNPRHPGPSADRPDIQNYQTSSTTGRLGAQVASAACYTTWIIEGDRLLASCLLSFFGLLLLRSATAKLRRPAAFWAILQQYSKSVLFRTAFFARLVPASE